MPPYPAIANNWRPNLSTRLQQRIANLSDQEVETLIVEGLRKAGEPGRYSLIGPR